MAYSKQTWHDLPDQTTPINAERLNHMEDGIYGNSLKIVDEYSEAQDRGYSANYLNNNFVETVDIEYEVPTKTGRRFKVNGVWKDEYIYYKNIGNLPSTATAVTIETSIPKSSITMITGTGGTAPRTSDGVALILSGARPSSNASAVAVQMGWSNDKFAFYIETGQDRSAWVGHCWVTYY